jgi:hypothetical protein
VTLYSVQTPEAIAPLSSSPELVSAGRVFQLMPVSVQSLAVAKTGGPSTVPEVEYTRRVAFWTVPAMPLTVNFR